MPNSTRSRRTAGEATSRTRPLPPSSSTSILRRENGGFLLVTKTGLAFWDRDTNTCELVANPLAASKALWFNDGAVVRYNISQNDGARIFQVGGKVTNARIYNNTIYVGEGKGDPLMIW